jgi:1-acyl-sn-glycerol-3-phosphate acyltransferase
MIYLRSLLFNILFFLWTILITLTATVGIVSQRFIVRVAYIWGLGTHFLLRMIIGVTYEIRGQENWDGKPAIFASKHQSILETTMIQVLAFNSVIILKRELTWIPFFGQAILRSGIIPLDRSKGRSVLAQLVQGAKVYLAQGRPIFIFPEGTRVSPQATTRLRYGIAALYKETGVRVIPVALNTGFFWGRRQFLKKPGKVIYQILPPIEPGMNEYKFLKHLEAVIEEACQQINKETQHA